MKIAILHYHLNTGGVTTVIRQQVEALKQDHDVIILTGEPPPTAFPVKVLTIKGIGYHHLLTPDDNPRDTANAISTAIRREFGGGCDILHVHNPLLAKNRHLLSILRRLQEKGVNLFLQVHDFAEDGRPQSYYFHDEYPSHCHYGVINSRDYGFLTAAGLEKDGLHRIENVISPHPDDGNTSGHRNFVLYPVRAIRRKNIGEALLLSCFFKEDESLMITQAPKSREDVNSYRDWKTFTTANGLNVVFEAGTKHDFQGLVRGAKYTITTSISEGFGFSFLEPWTANKGLWGRKLPDVCVDFENRQLNLDPLYAEIQVPLDWIGAPAFKKKWLEAYQKAHDFFGYALPVAHMMERFDGMTATGLVDFGVLDESSQKTVILRILSTAKDKQYLIHLNPHLSDGVTAILDEHIIQKNKNAVLTHYHMKGYAERLTDIYRQITHRSVHQTIDKSVLFSMILKNTRFSLLKWSPYLG